jgi:hypothetical protein
LASHPVSKFEEDAAGRWCQEIAYFMMDAVAAVELKAIEYRKKNVS